MIGSIFFFLPFQLWD